MLDLRATDILVSELYPELVPEGLAGHLRTLMPDVVISAPDAVPLTAASVSIGKTSFAHLYLAQSTRAFSILIPRVQQGKNALLWTRSLSAAVACAHSATHPPLVADIPTLVQQIDDLREIEDEEDAALALVEHTWLTMLETDGAAPPLDSLVPVCLAAWKNPKLRSLMPFTSMYWLCFGRFTTYPFAGLDLTIAPTPRGFVVCDSHFEPVSEPDLAADDAVAFVAARIPSNERAGVRRNTVR